MLIFIFGMGTEAEEVWEDWWLYQYLPPCVIQRPNVPSDAPFASPGLNQALTIQLGSGRDQFAEYGSDCNYDLSTEVYAMYEDGSYVDQSFFSEITTNWWNDLIESITIVPQSSEQTDSIAIYF